MGASTTLDEVGFIEWLKSDDAKGIKNYKGEAAAAEAAGKQGEAATLRRQGFASDIFFSGASAISETGEIVTGDLTGTRSSGLFTAGHGVVIVGSHKIVKSYDDAVDRLYNFQLPLESARCRIAYKIAGSSVNNMFAIKSGNPWGKGHIHVIIVNELVGF